MLEFQRGTASEADINIHLTEASPHFEPPLSSYVDIGAYSKKLHERSVTFEAWEDGRLVGLVAAYFDPHGSGKGFISNCSVLHAYLGEGVAADLLVEALSYAAKAGVSDVELEVRKGNSRAVSFYKKHEFEVVDDIGDHFRMSRPTGA